MSTSRRFRIRAGGATVSGLLHHPAATDGDAHPPAALLCAGYPTEPEDIEDLLDQTAGALTDAGVAAVTFRPRFAAKGATLGTFSAEDLVDDASAVFRWMLMQEDLDPQRIGVLGYSSAGVVAACLAGRTDRIAGLCLLAPTTAELVAGWSSEDGDPERRRAGALPPEFEESIRSLHPIDDAAAFDRPTLILHGAADRTVSAEISLSYRDRIENASHQVDHVLIARGDHGFSTVESRVACLELVMGFFASLPSHAEAADQS